MALLQRCAKGAEKHGSTLIFHSFMRVTRAAREGIFSLRLGSGGSLPIRKPLSAFMAALSVRTYSETVFSVKAFDDN